MRLQKRQKLKIKLCTFNRCLLLIILAAVYCVAVIFRNIYGDESNLLGLENINAALNVFKIDEKCINLPQIKPSGGFFLDGKVHEVPSLEGISPPFKIGSFIGDRVKYHMGDDMVHFHLIQELLSTQTHKNGKKLAFDIGANQGFYTYYLAALGMDVHSFEISSDNFVALMHGTHFNTKETADRVNLYPMGLDNKVSRFSLSGKDYLGYLKDSDDGPILGVTFDCFAYHTKLNLSDVAFVKLDVEGFEIAVLQGAANSLFNAKGKVGGMLMEVGPARWKRAKIDFETGVTEMRKLASNFKNSYLLARHSGGKYDKTCPTSLADEILSDKSPRTVLDRAKMFRVGSNELRKLLKKLEEKDYDCNFWYTNIK